MFGFDQVIDRTGTASLKWSKYGPDVLPLWVADMDFPSPPPVVDALKARAEHGVFGYTLPPDSLRQAIVSRLARLYDWQVEPDWLLFLPGLVPALNLICRAGAEPGQEVLCPTPIYPPFLTAPRYQDRPLVRVPSRCTDGRWSFAASDIAAALTGKSKVLLYCNPHNPVGRAYRRKEVLAVAELCCERDLILCSDEIHCELQLDAGRHVPAASLAPEIAARTITLMAPSKTFNTPGLATAFVVISNRDLRRRFQHACRGLVWGGNAMGYAACEAAFREGDPWLQELLDYLRGNRDLVESFVAGHPDLSMAHVEATYLAWIDFRRTGLDEPHKHCLQAGVGLSHGADFGSPGWLRLNFGCPRSVLREALDRIAAATGQTAGPASF